jgi:hypothetical protein
MIELIQFKDHSHEKFLEKKSAKAGKLAANRLEGNQKKTPQGFDIPEG